jgi:hypothetical protein
MLEAKQSKAKQSKAKSVKASKQRELPTKYANSLSIH